MKKHSASTSAWALDDLNRQSLERKQKQYPTVPAYGLIMPKFTDKNSNGLTKCILEYFRIHGGYAVRINTQGQYNEKLGKWTKSSTKLGTADIHACLNGTHYSIEIKIGPDRQSVHQKETEEQVKAAGGMYFVARTYQEFYDWMSQRKEEGE